MGAEGVRQLSLAETTKQSSLSLVSNLGAILAGLLVASSLGLFLQKPWIVALYPGILSMRGVIGGLFSGRLSTGLHLGTVEPRILGRKTETFHTLLNSTVVLTFGSSMLLGSFAFVFGTFFWGMTPLDMITILGILVSTMGLSILAVSPITIVVAFSSAKKGLDPDIIVYPITATMADILVTICYVLVLSLTFSMGEIGQLIVWSICLMFAFIAANAAFGNRKEGEFVRTIQEALLTMIAVALIVNVTGSILTNIGLKPAIFLVYPALLDVIGGFGAIIGSTATTKLALGTIDSSFTSIRSHRNQIAGAWTAAVIMYLILALVSSFYQHLSDLVLMSHYIIVFCVTNIVAAAFMICISFSVAILTFQRGLDPDNFVIPIESSLADTVTTVALLLALECIA
ncbi:MAG: magnesium transporter [Candidatus Bathyarchaeota archaeon]|nr:MAG: magnesium transporter [Candidatus Bathyarchaeota archaeon]